MERVKSTELRAAARVTDALVYVAGLAGVVAGALLFRDGNLPFAIIAWVLAFVAGAVLRLAAWAALGLAQVLDTTSRISEDVAALRRDQAADEEGPPGFRGWH